MSGVRVDDLHKKWLKDSKYRREYKALEAEFSLVSALIAARTRAGLSQQEVANRMKTTQAVIARLEGGGSKPSTRTISCGNHVISCLKHDGGSHDRSKRS